MISNYGQKFQSPRGDTTFTITHNGVEIIVDIDGLVISPPGQPLDYYHTDGMVGNQSGFTGIVKDFLTVTPELDTPPSIPW